MCVLCVCVCVCVCVWWWWRACVCSLLLRVFPLCSRVCHHLLPCVTPPCVCVCPPHTVYIVGSPGLPSANLTIVSPRPLLAMVAHGWSPAAVYVSSVKVNGQPLDSSYVQHDVLFARTAGNLIEFVMSETPVTTAA